MEDDKSPDLAPPEAEKPRLVDLIAQWRRKDTRKTAINANCQHCVGGDHDKGWQTRIRECEITSCTLWKWRPYRK